MVGFTCLWSIPCSNDGFKVNGVIVTTNKAITTLGKRNANLASVWANNDSALKQSDELEVNESPKY